MPTNGGFSRSLVSTPWTYPVHRQGSRPMSVDSRSPLRALRRKKEDERPDYSEPDFSGWSAKLDDFIPAGKAAPAKVEAAQSSFAPVAPVAARVAVVKPAPAVEAVDNR